MTDTQSPEDSRAILESLAQATSCAKLALTGGDSPASDSCGPEVRYRVLVEQIPAIIFFAALNGGLNEIYVSPQIEQILGYAQKEWLEDPVLWYTRLHPDDRDRWQLTFARTCTAGQPFCADYRFLARDGRVVWVHGEARMVLDEQGQPLFLQGVAFDITEQKLAEESLRRSHAELEELVQQRTAELRGTVAALRREIQERERVQQELSLHVRELEEAQGEIQHLRGLLSICCYCNKVCDDHNSWQKVEDYLMIHSDLRFSHGICPSCLEREMTALKQVST